MPAGSMGHDAYMDSLCEQAGREDFTKTIRRSSKMAVISGPCKWASVQQPNTKFEPCWTIDVIITEEQKTNLEAAGFKTKLDKDGDTIFKVKRKVHSKEGKEFDKPDVVDAADAPFTQLIGNGSVVKVTFSPYDWEAMGNAGKAGWLNKVTVLEHVPYEEEDTLDFGGGPEPVKDDLEDDSPF